MDTVHIDGSFGEGGGQVLRTSLSLAALLRRPVEITNIRAGRPKPGLAAQHVTCVRAAAAVCGATVSGDEIGSRQLSFEPGKPASGSYRFDVADVRPSAGSTGLVLQTVLPPLLFTGGDSRVTIRGGTNVPWSPCYEYLADVFLPAIQRAGAQVTLQRTRGGWYPAGGGEIIATVQPPPQPLQPFDLADPGKLASLRVTSTVSDRLPEHIVKRQTTAALRDLPHEVSRLAKRVVSRPTGGPGTCLAIAATYGSGHAGATALGERGKPAEKVGAEAAGNFTAFLESGAAVDAHLGDQLLLYAALADGTSVILSEAATEHLRTNAAIIQRFLDVEIGLEGNAPVRITVRGPSLSV